MVQRHSRQWSWASSDDRFKGRGPTPCAEFTRGSAPMTADEVIANDHPARTERRTTTQVNVEGSACINWFVALYRRLAAGRRESSPVVRRWLASLRSASKSAEEEGLVFVAATSCTNVHEGNHFAPTFIRAAIIRCPLVSFVANWINAIRSIGNGLVNRRRECQSDPHSSRRKW